MVCRQEAGGSINKHSLQASAADFTPLPVLDGVKGGSARAWAAAQEDQSRYSTDC